MEQINTPFVFQVDSPLVKEALRKDNFLIMYDENSSDKSKCAIYFSSNDIYFPNSEGAFKDKIVEKNVFEWFGTRLASAYKHIFVRDIQKQWYLEGINNNFDTIEKMYDFLLNESKGYKIITIGSSAGGYAAVLFGGMLFAERIYTFNGQFMLEDLLVTSTEAMNPLIFRNRDRLSINKYFSLRNYVVDGSKIFYFLSKNSKWDYSQYNHIKDMGINVILFNTSHHGIPFLKIALRPLLNTSNETDLIEMSTKLHHPILFSIRFVGVKKTIFFLVKLLFDRIKLK